MSYPSADEDQSIHWCCSSCQSTLCDGLAETEQTS